MTPAPLTLQPASAVLPFGATTPACSVLYTGLVRDDTPTSIGPLSTCGYPPRPESHAVTPTAITPANYSVRTLEATVLCRYPSGSGIVPPPTNLVQFARGRDELVRFALQAPDGVTPYADRTFRLSAGSASSIEHPFGDLTYVGGGIYERGVMLRDRTLGPITIIVTFDDGTSRTVSGVVR